MLFRRPNYKQPEVLGKSENMGVFGTGECQIDRLAAGSHFSGSISHDLLSGMEQSLANTEEGSHHLCCYMLAIHSVSYT